MSDREFLVLTTGGLLLASGIKRAESALTRDVRGTSSAVSTQQRADGGVVPATPVHP